MATKKEVVEVKENAVAMFADMEQDANMVDTGISNTDTAMPFLMLLQSLSPQVQRNNPARVDGAEEGMFYHSLLGTVYDHLCIIPVFYRKANVEWVARENGGGWQGERPDSDLTTCTKGDKGQNILPNGNHLVPTMYYYCLIKGEQDEHWTPVVMSFANSAQRNARRWNSMILSARVQGTKGLFQPPMFGQKFKLTAEYMSNKLGSWYIPQVKADGFVTDPDLYQMAKSFHESFKTMDHSTVGRNEQQVVEEAEAPF